MSGDERFYDPSIDDGDTLTRDIKLSAIMLYPESEDERKKYVVKLMLSRLAEEEELECQKEGSDLSAFQIEQGAILGRNLSAIGGWRVAKAALLVGEQPDFALSVLKRMRSGILAGILLDMALSDKCSIPKAARKYCHIYDTAEEENAKFVRQKSKESYHNKYKGISLTLEEQKGLTLNLQEQDLCTNIWGNFQNVAHLFSAFCKSHGLTEFFGNNYFKFDKIKLNLPGTIIGDKDVFPTFCAIACKYRELGMNYSPFRRSQKDAPKTLLTEKCWKISLPLGAPTIDGEENPTAPTA